MEFVELAFRRFDDRSLKLHHYIEWAERLLEEGSESSSVAQLASCSWEAEPDANQVERLFQSSLIELGLSLPNGWHQALLAYAGSICRQLVLGKMAPWDCMNEMLQLSEDTNEPYILWIWVNLIGELSQEFVITDRRFVFNVSLDLQDSEECIRKTALQFVSLCSADLPQKFPAIWLCTTCSAISHETTLSESLDRSCPVCGLPQAMKNMRFFENREELARKIRNLPIG